MEDLIVSISKLVWMKRRAIFRLPDTPPGIVKNTKKRWYIDLNIWYDEDKKFIPGHRS